MKYHVLTLFPDMIMNQAHTSILGRALDKSFISLECIDIRDFAANKYNRVDDYPYGGGAGMVMESEPVYRSIQHAKKTAKKDTRVIYLTPQGKVLNQTLVEELAQEEELILLCGHYEGIDDRVLEEEVTDFVSIGDYVLTGGELGALVLIDAVSRFVPGVLSNEESAQFESHQDNLLEYPHYTRPPIWHEKEVPAILLSGDHDKIEQWRHEKSILRTKERRPDLYQRSRNVYCLFYGNEIEAMAETLCSKVSRYGVNLSFNRKKLRKTQYHFTDRDYLLFIFDQSVLTTDERPIPFTNVQGKDTFGSMIYLVNEPGEACHESVDSVSAHIKDSDIKIEEIQYIEKQNFDHKINQIVLNIKKKLL